MSGRGGGNSKKKNDDKNDMRDSLIQPTSCDNFDCPDDTRTEGKIESRNGRKSEKKGKSREKRKGKIRPLMNQEDQVERHQKKKVKDLKRRHR